MDPHDELFCLIKDLNRYVDRPGADYDAIPENDASALVAMLREVWESMPGVKAMLETL